MIALLVLGLVMISWGVGLLLDSHTARRRDADQADARWAEDFVTVIARVKEPR